MYHSRFAEMKKIIHYLFFLLWLYFWAKTTLPKRINLLLWTHKIYVDLINSLFFFQNFVHLLMWIFCKIHTKWQRKRKQNVAKSSGDSWKRICTVFSPSGFINIKKKKKRNKYWLSWLIMLPGFWNVIYSYLRKKGNEKRKGTFDLKSGFAACLSQKHPKQTSPLLSISLLKCLLQWQALEGSDPNCDSGLGSYFHCQHYKNIQIWFKWG